MIPVHFAYAASVTCTVSSMSVLVWGLGTPHVDSSSRSLNVDCSLVWTMIVDVDCTMQFDLPLDNKYFD